jgi:hypothetical protein
MIGNSVPMPISSTVRAFRKLPGHRRVLLLEALLALAWSSLLVRWLPFRTVLRLAGRGTQRRGQPAAAQSIVAEIVWAVQAIGRRVPWRAVCFQQGLAVHQLLRKRGIGTVLHYGVGQGPEGLKAHVWVTHEDRAVIGGEEAPSFACLASVPPLPARS